MSDAGGPKAPALPTVSPNSTIMDPVPVPRPSGCTDPSTITPTPACDSCALVLLLIALCALATGIIFSCTHLDLTVTRLFVSVDGQGHAHWPCIAWPVVRWIYRYGPIPGVALGAGAAILVGMACWRPCWSAWKRPALFVVLALALGPGLLVNTVSKDHCGRSRPRDLVDFGGAMTYGAPGVIHPASTGKAFPCGHSSVGFTLGLTMYLLLRRGRPRWALGALATGLAYGGILGLARISVGAHFLSDVLWSAYLPALTTLGLWHLLTPDRSPTAAVVAEPDAVPRHRSLLEPLAPG